MAAQVEELSQVLCFTDPSLLGHTVVNGMPYFTKTGDVDDVACILYLAQKYNDKITFCICDDGVDLLRWREFNTFIGNDLTQTYGCKILSQLEFTGSATPIMPNTIVHLHAPIKLDSVNHLSANIENISKFYTQGSTPNDTNFKNNTAMWELVNGNSKTTMFTSVSTNVPIKYKPDFADKLTGKPLQVYEDYFTFQTRKQIGLAIGIPGLNDRLYSDTGLDGNPGNGIKNFKTVITELKEAGDMPSGEELIKQLGVCNEIVDRMYTVTGNGRNVTTIANLKDLVWILKQYCNYDELLIIDDAGNQVLPSMGNLGTIVKNPDCNSKIVTVIEGATKMSTPLFDLAAAAFANGIDQESIEDLAETCITRFYADMIKKGGKRRKSKHRKTKRNKRSRRRVK